MISQDPQPCQPKRLRISIFAHIYFRINFCGIFLNCEKKTWTFAKNKDIQLWIFEIRENNCRIKMCMFETADLYPKAADDLEVAALAKS